jgi:hypothetical protein
MSRELEGISILLGSAFVVSVLVHWRLVAFSRAVVTSGAVTGVLGTFLIHTVTLLQGNPLDPMFLVVGPFVSATYAIGVSLVVGAPFALFRWRRSRGSGS